MIKRQLSRKNGARSLGLSALAMLLGSAIPVLAAAESKSDTPCDRQASARPANPCAPKRDRKCPDGQVKAAGNPCAPKKAEGQMASRAPALMPQSSGSVSADKKADPTAGK